MKSFPKLPNGIRSFLMVTSIVSLFSLYLQGCISDSSKKKCSKTVYVQPDTNRHINAKLETHEVQKIRSIINALDAIYTQKHTSLSDSEGEALMYTLQQKLRAIVQEAGYQLDPSLKEPENFGQFAIEIENICLKLGYITKFGIVSIGNSMSYYAHVYKILTKNTSTEFDSFFAADISLYNSLVSADKQIQCLPEWYLLSGNMLQGKNMYNTHNDGQVMLLRNGKKIVSIIQPTLGKSALAIDTDISIYQNFVLTNEFANRIAETYAPSGTNIQDVHVGEGYSDSKSFQFLLSIVKENGGTIETPIQNIIIREICSIFFTQDPKYVVSKSVMHSILPIQATDEASLEHYLIGLDNAELVSLLQTICAGMKIFDTELLPEKIKSSHT